jgi:predicted dehydrogenase
LGADGHFYRRQLEGFADVILNGAPQAGATIDDGIASVRGMVAIARSVERGNRVSLADVTGGV